MFLLFPIEMEKYMLLWFLIACQSEPQSPQTPSVPVQQEATGPKGLPINSPKGPPPKGMKGEIGPKGGPNTAAGSGGEFQDPSGFPPFHDWPAPQGPSIVTNGDWTAAKMLSSKPTGGYRPQIAVGSDDGLHVVYYDRTDQGDIIRHRISTDGKTWSKPVPLGHSSERNWGPDIVTREDGSIVVVYDHALANFSSRGFLTVYENGRWSKPEPLTPDDGGEIGSGHIANTVGTDLAYVFIGKQLGPEHKFQARWRWRTEGQWSDIAMFSAAKADAWHTNVERRPDGSVVAGFDIGTGGAATTLFIVEGRDGTFSPLENISQSGKPGERPHFAFGEGVDYVTWFHKESGQPKHIYVRSKRSGEWGEIEEPSQGFGGFHFDPEIAINNQGTLCLVWGWDSGKDAEMVYSINKGEGWTSPRKIADIDWGKPGLASLDVDSDGKFHIVWNQGVRGYNEVYYAALDAQ
jgi:hypothetical protein